MGIVLGLVLAGVEGLSAKTQRAVNYFNILNIDNSENTKQREKYWFETGLSMRDVEGFISNDKCYSSEKYFSSCLNTIIESALEYNLKLSFADGRLVKLYIFDGLDEKNEKERLHLYLNYYSDVQKRIIDFNQITSQLMELEVESKKSMQAAQMINSFLSVNEDPHTYIMPANYYDEVGSKIERSKYFIGISYEKINGNIYIKKVYKNSDAEISGLSVNDKVLAINSIDLVEAKIDMMSRLLKNENFSVLNFKVERNNKILEVELKRSYRQLSHVQYNQLSTDKNYGLMTLSKFNPGVCSEMSKILSNINKNKIEGLVLDLRDNPGGQLNEAACVAGLFLGKNKKAYYVEYFDIQKPNEVVLTSQEQVYHGALVVLVNGASASASELLAGGLQEYGRALIVGERTFGKGTFQEPEPWSLNSKVSLFKTQGFYLLPSRNSTQLVGVRPDIELQSHETPVKGEAGLYFNPIAKATKTYPNMKNDVEKKLSLLNLCKNKKLAVAKVAMPKDSYLQKSLNYLSCAHQSEKLANINAGEAPARGF